MPEWIQDLQFDFYQSFIEDNRWKYIVRGLGITLEVAFFALLLGVTLGVLVAVIRSTHDQQGKRIHGFPGFILSVLNFICKIYTTVVRGTPVMVQLLIMYFVIMVSSTNQVLSEMCIRDRPWDAPPYTGRPWGLKTRGHRWKWDLRR